MGIFQKVNGWLTERGDHIARDGDASRTANSAYYASSEAEQAYGGMRKPAAEASMPSDTRTAGNETGRFSAADRFSADSDKYGGRVPYRSQKDMQAEADQQRQQQEEQARRQQVAAQQMKPQQAFGRAPAQGYAQPQSNIVQFPGMIRGPEGNLYAHVEYVVLLRSRNECTKVIEYIKANASVFLNMEFIANDSERQRCVDMLSGAAYTLGCQLNKISQRGIYLISSPSVCVVIDPAMQKYATAPEAQGYVRPEYAAYGNYPSQGYGAQAGPGARPSGYGGPSASGYAAGARTAAYGAQPSAASYNPGARTSTYGNAATAGNASAGGARTAAYGAQPSAAGYTPGARAAAYANPSATAGTPTGGNSPSAYPAQSAASGYAAGARTAAYRTQPTASAQTGAYQAQPGFSAGAQTGAYQAQPGFSAGTQTGAYQAQPSFNAGAQTGAYAAQAAAGQAGMGAQTGAYAGQRQPGFNATAQPKRAMPAFGMQGPFTKSAENSAGR
ncbi:MAG TPA: cell division protein SepF [Candidatus Limiplasma sp.]|nr:cell division protein SepF [Candidatus Limiplasma sp.]HPS81743.1 cell division protein SepF [Candidatus Limiplasma sp.]